MYPNLEGNEDDTVRGDAKGESSAPVLVCIPKFCRNTLANGSKAMLTVSGALGIRGT